MATCVRCLSVQNANATQRKRKKVRRGGLGTEYTGPLVLETPLEETASLMSEQVVQEIRSEPQAGQTLSEAQVGQQGRLPLHCFKMAYLTVSSVEASSKNTQKHWITDKMLPIFIQRCKNICLHVSLAVSYCLTFFGRKQNQHANTVVVLYVTRSALLAGRQQASFVVDKFPSHQWLFPMAHLFSCSLLPLSVPSSALVGTMHAIISQRALPVPTPDGIGISDGLRAYDACNANSYQDKRKAAQSLQSGDVSKARSLLTSAVSTAVTDTTGCNGAEAAIYLEDLQVRQSGHPYGMIVVSFDSGPGNADPHGGTDRHILYAAYTQELVGAFIAQQQYNLTQMQTPGAPLLYLVLANTTGVEQGALQIAEIAASLASGSTSPQQLGLLTSIPVGKNTSCTRSARAWSEYACASRLTNYVSCGLTTDCTNSNRTFHS